MKKSILFLAVLFSCIITAQNIKPTYEKVDENKVKGTFFHDNGKVQQQGFYVNGKLDGQWVSYNEAGNKVSEGNYSNGVKTGTWFFYDGKTLSEISYNSNKIASVKTWDDTSTVVANFKK